MAGRSKNIFANLDWITIALVLLISLFGWMNIYGAGYDFDQTSIVDFSNRAGKQFVWLLTAGVLAVLICLTNYRIYESVAYFVYGLLMVVIIITPLVASNVKGSYSWISLGPVSLQPAEFMKCATALAIARYTSQYGYRIRDWRDMIIPGAMLLFPMAIIAVWQSETGSALVFVSFLLAFYRLGMSGYVLSAILLAAIIAILSLRIGWWICLIIIFLMLGIYLFYNRKRLFHVGSLRRYWSEWATLAVATILYITLSFSCSLVFNRVLKPYQRERIELLLGMREDPAGVGYNVAQSRIAIGSGQFLGLGYLQGTQTKLHFVPEQDTDFIFCTVGEEWGFLGSSLLLLTYLAFLLRLLRIAERQHDRFSMVYAYCVFGIFLFHLTINIGMVLGLMPVIGIPLPFFSYGGSSFWGFTLLLFILLRLDAARVEQLH